MILKMASKEELIKIDKIGEIAIDTYNAIAERAVMEYKIELLKAGYDEISKTYSPDHIFEKLNE